MSFKQIGLTIKERRKALKIIQADLAEIAGVSVNTLYKIERGQGNPSIEVIEKIASVIGMELKLEIKKNAILDETS